MPATPYYHLNRPMGDRINFRLIATMILFSFLVGWPVYGFIKHTINHGIEKTRTGYNVDLKSLGCFKFNEMTGTLNDIPAPYRDLDGKEVALEGFMYVGQNASDRVNDFQFVYNIQQCCFLGPPLVQERVFATAPGDGVAARSCAFRIIGTLHLALTKDAKSGNITKVYTMDVKRDEPL